MVVFLFFIPAVWQGQTNHSSIFSKSCVLAVKKIRAVATGRPGGKQSEDGNADG
jgi:hypothetical protein